MKLEAKLLQFMLKIMSHLVQRIGEWEWGSLKKCVWLDLEWELWFPKASFLPKSRNLDSLISTKESKLFYSNDNYRTKLPLNTSLSLKQTGLVELLGFVAFVAVESLPVG